MQQDFISPLYFRFATSNESEKKNFAKSVKDWWDLPEKSMTQEFLAKSHEYCRTGKKISIQVPKIFQTFFFGVQKPLASLQK